VTKQIRKNLVHPGQRHGSGSKAINHAGASQIGAAQGNHFTNGGADGRMESRYGGVDVYSEGPGYNKAKYGNEVAKNVGAGGPGTGRNVMSCGSQGTHGGVAGNKLNPQDPLAPWSRK
jgi:hypothetical protein